MIADQSQRDDSDRREAVPDGSQSARRSASRHGLSARLVPAAVLGFEAVLLVSSADVPSLVGPVLALAGCLGLLLHARWLEYPRVFRSLVALGVVLMFVRLIGFPPPAHERGFVVLPRSLTISLAELLVGCQVLVLWRWRKDTAVPVSFSGLALITLVLALNKTLAKDSTESYVFLATVSLLVPVLMARPLQGGRLTPGPRMTRGARFVLVLVCGGILAGTMLATEAWVHWLPDAQRWFATTVGRTLNTEQQLSRYATSGSLSVIRWQNTTDPNSVALRVHADRTPGYLAGRTFDHYLRGEWINVWEAQSARSRGPWLGLRELEPLQRAPDALDIRQAEMSVFELDPRGMTDSLRRLAVENDPRRGRVYFTPPGSRYFVGAGESLDVDQHDIVRAGVSVRTPYIVFHDPSTPAPPLSTALRAQLLRLPEGMDGRVRDLSARICRNRSSTRDKVTAIRDFFQENFQYSLDPVDLPRTSDPLQQFLLTRHPAHCEFFASAAVILLRYQGVPARYVTGYRVMAMNEDEDYWVGRNRDAHAWAEAYDQLQQRWIIVEATPGFAQDEALLVADNTAATAAAGGLAFTAQKASQLAQWWQNLSLWVRVPLCLVLLGVLASILHFSVRRARWRVARRNNTGDPRALLWQRLLAVVDRRLSKHGWVRAPHETLHQFARRLAEHAEQAGGASGQEDNPDWLGDTARWYVHYADTRFRPSCTEPPALPPARPRRRRWRKAPGMDRSLRTT